MVARDENKENWTDRKSDGAMDLLNQLHCGWPCRWWYFACCNEVWCRGFKYLMGWAQSGILGSPFEGGNLP